MFIDARDCPDGTVVRSTVCVIGAGVAGLTIARELNRANIDCCLVESGGFTPEERLADLYRGESVEPRYHFADGSRSRYFGGSSNCWAGWSRPFDPIDFVTRDWVTDSGWPFTGDELTRFAERATSVLELDTPDYGLAEWGARLAKDGRPLLDVQGSDLESTVIQLSPPTRLGVRYREELRRARHVAVYLHANVTELEMDPEKDTIRRVHVRTLDGSRLVVEAATYVLACGGIDNARVLLASQGRSPAGVGNDHDVVGRYYMDHPRATWGYALDVDALPALRAYDARFQGRNRWFPSNRTLGVANFAVRAATQEARGMLNSRAWVAATFRGDRTNEAWEGYRRRDTPPAMRSRRAELQGIVGLARHPISLGACVATRVLRPARLLTGFQLHAIVESDPNSQSRITLLDERDALGMQRVRVDWRMGDLVKHTFDETFTMLAAELAGHGWSVVPTRGLLGHDWPDDLDWGTWHHIGTTRMHASPRLGVVDADCRVHGVANLFVAGSSVFPTSGCNFPTFTLTCLALRLADHLVLHVRS